MGKSYLDNWQILQSGNADQDVVKRAYRQSFTLATVGCAMVMLALVGLALL